MLLQYTIIRTLWNKFKEFCIVTRNTLQNAMHAFMRSSKLWTFQLFLKKLNFKYLFCNILSLRRGKSPFFINIHRIFQVIPRRWIPMAGASSCITVYIVYYECQHINKINSMQIYLGKVEKPCALRIILALKVSSNSHSVSRIRLGWNHTCKFNWRQLSQFQFILKPELQKYNNGDLRVRSPTVIPRYLLSTLRRVLWDLVWSDFWNHVHHMNVITQHDMSQNVLYSRLKHILQSESG
jgi:hypothetical protein